MAAFGVMFAAGAILLILNLTIVHQKLEARLQLRGITIAKLLAPEVITHVLTENFAVLELMLRNRLGDEQDIEYAFVTNRKGDVIAHTFGEGFPSALKSINVVPAGQPFSAKRFSTKKNTLIDIAIPLLKGDLGQLHIGLSEDKIREETKELIWSIIWFIPVTMILAGVVFTVFARFITKPLLGLAKSAEQASRGNFDVRFEASSRDEVGNLGNAFNNMIAARKKVEQERELLITELQTALLEIKALSGLLPICAWCKKIRDDKGYWQQIEGYISKHSEAEFSHGICPDCLKEVSRETYELLDKEQKRAGDTSATQGNSY